MSQLHSIRQKNKMSDSKNQDYLQIGFNDSLQRSDSLVYPLGDQSLNAANPQGPYVTNAMDNGSVQNMTVNNDGSMGDVWINNFIRSTNWKPKTVGFYIDGQTGYAEFSGVYISGTIVAMTGTIGGFTIGATDLSATSGGNTTKLSSLSTAFSAGPTGAPTITITQAGIITAVGAIFDGTSTIGGRLGSTIAGTIDSNGNVITSVFTTATKQILDGFAFTQSGALNVSGTQTAVSVAASIGDTTLNVTSTAGFPSTGVLYLQGNTHWMRITYTGLGGGGTTITGIPNSSTGSITEASAIAKQVIGGPGILITPKGLVGLNSSGVETFTIDGGTGNATFAGTLVAAAGTLGTITSGSIYSGIFSTGANGSTSTRMMITNSDNTITFYNSSNVAVAQMGGGTYIASALRITNDSSTTDGVVVTSTVSGGVGFRYTNDSNVSNNAIVISQQGTTSNSNPSIQLTRAGAGDGIFMDYNGTGRGLLIDMASTGSYPIEILNAGLANSIDIEDTGGNANSISISNTTGGGNSNNGINLTVTTNTGTPVGIVFNITRSAGGNAYAFQFTGTEFASSGFVGSIFRKVRVLFPSGNVGYIYCYDG